MADENLAPIKCPACGLILPRGSHACDCGHVIRKDDRSFPTRRFCAAFWLQWLTYGFVSLAAIWLCLAWFTASCVFNFHQ